ncbi:MAG: hypothetical protein C4550_07065 [Nitrospiraceae bacterium]|nr:MAG: hypothetical protein C4550_07065 [Nitrospiraceae bacterium]
MTKDKNVVHLNVFLVKASYNDANSIIHQDKCLKPLEIVITGYGKGELYIKISTGGAPKWASFFDGEIDVRLFGKVSSVAAVFLFKTDDRYFVLTFGQGGRFLIKEDVCEERFGLIVALNSVDKDSFRCVDKQTFDTIQSHTRIQSIKETTADQFGLDVEQDILRAIVGSPRDHNLGTRMTGSDSLSVSAKVDLSDLPLLLKSYREKFEETSYRIDYPWVNNIAEIKSSSTIIYDLDAKLLEKFAGEEPSGLWLSVPEIIQWDSVKGFIYSGGRKIIHSDINLEGFLCTIDDKAAINLDTLKKRHVYCADDDHNRIYKSWSIYKCLYAEIDHDNATYILNGGKWFIVDRNFVARTDLEFARIDRSLLSLPHYKGGSEGNYNDNVANMFPDKYALMDDRNRIFHSGGHGQVEFCDLFSTDKEIIHIKKYGQSSVFSHLFSQGFVSGQLLQLDAEFRRKVVEKLKNPFNSLIKVDSRPDVKEFSVVFGIISDSEDNDLHLPFFSRVNLNNAAKKLKGFGYRVELLKICVDQTYAKNKICPPGRKGKA